jgi:hypothetical protein
MHQRQAETPVHKVRIQRNRSIDFHNGSLVLLLERQDVSKNRMGQRQIGI